MYEQNEVSMLRRILWYALWTIVLIAAIWILVWLIFFRNSNPKNTSKTPTSQSTSSTSSDNKSSHSGAAKSSPSSSNSGRSSTSAGNTAQNGSSPTGSSNAPQPPAASPSQLTNTGPGDVIVPALVATVIGSTVAYTTVRRKLLHS